MIRMIVSNAILHHHQAVKIIGLCGFAGSGKDYIANLLHQHYGYHKVALANGFKHKVVGSGSSYERVFTSGEKDSETRHLLQQEGTERGRDLFGRDVWIKTLESYIRWQYEHNGIVKFVISDVRFHNELQWVNTIGSSIWINSDRAYNLDGDQANHPSEAEMREMNITQFTDVMVNHKTITSYHLMQQLKVIMR